MPRLSRMVVMWLLLTMAVVFSGVPAMASVPVRADHPAGCHGHVPARHLPLVPSPAPVSYECCVIGHDAALPSAAFTLCLTSAAAQLSSLDAGNSAGFDSVTSLYPTMLLVPISPPGAAPLRI